MSTLAFDETTKDILIANNKAVIITDPVDEVVQRLRARLRLFQGEWFLNLAKGTPYFQEIFVKKKAPAKIEAAIKREILSTPGVTELLEFTQELDGTTRKLTVSFKARSTTGEIIDFSEAVP